MSEYAVVVDETYHAVLLRDLLRKAAEDYYLRESKAVHATIRARHQNKADVFAKYAERFEHIRLQEVERVSASLGLSDG